MICDREIDPQILWNTCTWRLARSGNPVTVSAIGSPSAGHLPTSPL